MDNTKSVIRQYKDSDEDAIIALNYYSESLLSPMDKKRFSLLRDNCSLLLVAEDGQEVIGFLMGFSENCRYDSVNYQWFDKRYNHFLYIDRVVIAESARSQGIGKSFYNHLEQWARSVDKPVLTAEVDIKPPNIPSLKFHQNLGFKEVGRQQYGNPIKEVCLFEKAL